MMLRLIFALCYACHILGCGWVVVGRKGSAAGVPNWLDSEMKGPFVALDTTGTGEDGDDSVFSIYVAAFYYSITTMTSIG